MKKEQVETKPDAIREYEQRWIKPTLITLGIILIPLLFVGLFIGPTMVKAVSQYDASISEAFTLVQRDDKEKFYDNTPKPERDPVATTKEDLPDGPVLVNFYLKHCPYCESSHGTIEGQRKAFVETNPEYKDNVVYVDVTSPIGLELIHEYDVMAAASMLFLDGDDTQVWASASDDEVTGQKTAEYANIIDAFQRLETALSTQD